MITRILYLQRLSQNFQERMALDRPVYSTPPPVESTPQNNECRLVDVHGHKIAAFTINHDEYICLPQVKKWLFWVQADTGADQTPKSEIGPFWLRRWA